MLKFISCIVTILLLLLSSNFELKTTINLKSKAEIFTTDNFENIYIYDNKLLKKYNVKGKLLSTFRNNTSSKLSNIDVTDPFNILLYYKNSNSIVFLDNNLSKIGNTIKLDKLGFYSVKAVCKSKQIAIWIFDEYENKLLQYNFSTKQISQQLYLNQDITEQVKIKEQANFIYLQSGGNKIYIYDNTGLLLENLEFKNKNIFQFKGENIMMYNKNYIYSYNIENRQTDSLELKNIKNFNKLRIENDLLYLLNIDSIFIYHKKESP